MRANFYAVTWVCLSLGASLALSQPAAGQTAQPFNPPPPGTPTAVSPPGSSPAGTRKPSPPAPGTRSPVDYFRQMLAMSPRERELALRNEPEPRKTYLLAKLQEYLAIPPDERELRLRLTQLHFHLRNLMVLPPTNRLERLELVPQDDRKIIEDRLKQWDKLSPEDQREFLDHEKTVSALFRQPSGTEPPGQRLEQERALARLRSMPEDRRKRVFGHFQQFFELSAKERDKTLNSLSDAERKQMIKTLQEFARLPAPQRDLCIESFHKLADLGPREREQFFVNVERWRAMTPGERETWRNLVHQLPPLPPGFPASAMPPKLPDRGNGAEVSSNRSEK